MKPQLKHRKGKRWLHDNWSFNGDGQFREERIKGFWKRYIRKWYKRYLNKCDKME